MFDPIFAPLTKTTNLYADPCGDRYRVVIPINANIAADTIGRYADCDDIALIHEFSDQSIETYTYRQIDETATKLAVSLTDLGVSRGDRVAIHTAQSPQTAIAHMAIYKLGAIAVTLSHLLGSDSITHILNDSGTSVIITNSEYWNNLRDHCRNLASLRHRIVSGTPGDNEISFEECLTSKIDNFEPAVTATEDPAILMYTSGATGNPKGVVLSHRCAHAYRPTLSLVYNLDLSTHGSVFWTPSDWAWSGGLFDLCLPAWQHKQTVVSTNRRLDADWAFEFMERHQVTHSFMTATALRRLAQVDDPRAHYNLAMRVVCTSGESLSGSLLDWCERKFGVVCNELYGLTEFTDMIGCCKKLFPTKPGSMGKAFPGRRVAIVDENGVELSNNKVGEIASLMSEDPTLILGYWGESGVPNDLKLGKWLRTNDLAWRDDQGYYWFKCRKDDLIKSAGYRIGPAEVEQALMSHLDVSEAVVVGKPDKDRGSVVVAFVQLSHGATPDDKMRRILQQHVKQRLALYQHPRIIEFVDSFPRTNSGKIRRNLLREKAANCLITTED